MNYKWNRRGAFISFCIDIQRNKRKQLRFFNNWHYILEKDGIRPTFMISENIKLHQNRNFYSKKWKLETIIWISIAVLLSMVFLIIIGAGPLSKKTIGSKEEGFIVELQTMLRYKRAFSLNFSVNPPYPGKDYRIRINKGFLKNMSTIKIMPEPEVTFIGKDDYIFSFNIPEPTKETRIVFYLEPVVTGITKLIVVQENGKVMETDAFIYP